jgi:hypothetical protein
MVRYIHHIPFPTWPLTGMIMLTPNHSSLDGKTYHISLVPRNMYPSFCVSDPVIRVSFKPSTRPTQTIHYGVPHTKMNTMVSGNSTSLRNLHSHNTGSLQKLIVQQSRRCAFSSPIKTKMAIYFERRVILLSGNTQILTNGPYLTDLPPNSPSEWYASSCHLSSNTTYLHNKETARTPFCYPILPEDEVVIVQPPQGYPFSRPNTFWRLHKIIYGLRRSPRH